MLFWMECCVREAHEKRPERSLQGIRSERSMQETSEREQELALYSPQAQCALPSDRS